MTDYFEKQIKSEKEINDAIIKVIGYELDRANAKFPLFNSPHEAYGVIKEETEEAVADISDIAGCFKQFWDGVKIDMCDDQDDAIRRMKGFVVRSITELVQVAAMCDKYEQSKARWRK